MNVTVTTPCCVDCDAAQRAKNATEEKELSGLLLWDGGGKEMSVKFNF